MARRLEDIAEPLMPLPYPHERQGAISAVLRVRRQDGVLVLEPSARPPTWRAIGFGLTLVLFAAGFLIVFALLDEPTGTAIDWVGRTVRWAVGLVVVAFAVSLPFIGRFAQRREVRRGAVIRVDSVRNEMTLCRIGRSLPLERVLGFEVIDAALTDPGSEGGSRVMQVVLVFTDEAGEPWRRLLWTFDDLAGPPIEALRGLGLSVRWVECKRARPLKSVMEKHAPPGSDAYLVPLGRSRTIDIGAVRAAPVPPKCVVCRYVLDPAAGYICPECGFNHFDEEAAREVGKSAS